MLLPAKKAREFVEASIAEKRKKELEEIEDSMTKVLYSDGFSCCINYNISDYAKSELEKLGYTVQYRANEDENWTFISW